MLGCAADQQINLQSSQCGQNHSGKEQHTPDGALMIFPMSPRHPTNFLPFSFETSTLPRLRKGCSWPFGAIH